MTALSPVGFEPPPEVIPAPPPPPDLLEAQARQALARRLGFGRVAVRAPSWREILFRGGKIDFRLPKFPDGAALKVDQKFEPTDDADRAAAKLIAGLSKSKPRGTAPRSISARRELPPSADALAAWKRKATLVVLGPEVARLLAASGGLTADDVEALDDAYPAGLDNERRDSVEAGMAITAAAARHKRDADLPDWLNDQILTLMAEARPTDFFQGLYGPEDVGDDQSNAPQGPSASGPPSRIAQQNTPPAGEGIT